MTLDMKGRIAKRILTIVRTIYARTELFARTKSRTIYANATLDIQAKTAKSTLTNVNRTRVNTAAPAWSCPTQPSTSGAKKATYCPTAKAYQLASSRTSATRRPVATRACVCLEYAAIIARRTSTNAPVIPVSTASVTI